MSIKVIIAGFKGRMGQAAYKMVSGDPELELAGLIDPFTDEDVYKRQLMNSWYKKLSIQR